MFEDHLFGTSGNILPICLTNLNVGVASESASVGHPPLLRYRISRPMLVRCGIRASRTLVLRSTLWVGRFLARNFRTSAHFCIAASHSMAALAAIVADTSALPNSIGVEANLSAAGFCQGITKALVEDCSSTKASSMASSIVDGTFLKRACHAGPCRSPFRNVGTLMCSVSDSH